MVAALLMVSAADPSIPDFEELECAMHQMAFEFGTAKVPSSPQALHDALILGNCSRFADKANPHAIPGACAKDPDVLSIPGMLISP